MSGWQRYLWSPVESNHTSIGAFTVRFYPYTLSPRKAPNLTI